MAESFAHKFGQTIGDMLQAAMEPVLADFAGSHRLYLDKKGPRPARKELKVTWTDRLGNRHDLDFVLERGGTRDKIGIPVAFIEAAWRATASRLQSAWIECERRCGAGEEGWGG